MKTVAFTGHRPPKLNGYNKGDNRRLLSELEDVILDRIEEGYDTFITGMAQGVDIWAGQIVADLRDLGGYLHLKLIAAVPFKGQESVWPPSAQEVWKDLLSRVNEVHVLESAFTPFALQSRNMWMVDRADLMLAVWDGTSGGTKNCIDYAESKDVPCINIDPTHFRR